MANDCLARSFKADSGNNNLPVLNTLVFHLKDSENYYYLELQGSSAFTITLDGASAGEGFATSISGLSNPQTTFTGTSCAFYFKAGDYDVLISNKYKLTKVNIRTRNAQGSDVHTGLNICSIDDFCFLIGLQQLYFLGLGLDNISLLKNVPALTFLYAVNCTFENTKGKIDIPTLATLYMQASNFDGNIENYVNSPVISGARISSDTIGTIDALVQNMVSKGNTTNSIAHLTLNTKIKFGKAALLEREYTLEWNTTSKITLLENPGGNNRVYAKGATQEEITAWENDGKTVYIWQAPYS